MDKKAMDRKLNRILLDINLNHGWVSDAKKKIKEQKLIAKQYQEKLDATITDLALVRSLMRDEIDVESN